MSRHKVEISGVNTANIKVLTSEETLELFKKMQEGDSLAREELINGNLKLVLSILKKFSGKTDNLDDLFQIGCLGLVKAIDNFDTKYEVKLSTYACPMIEGEIKRYLRDNNSIRISRSIKDLAYKTLKLKEELSVGEKEPTNKEIADILGVREYDITVALDSLREPVSMYEPIYNDGGDTIYLYDQIANKEDEYGIDNKLALDKAMHSLKKREINIRYVQNVYSAAAVSLFPRAGTRLDFCLVAPGTGTAFRTSDPGVDVPPPSGRAVPHGFRDQVSHSGRHCRRLGQGCRGLRCAGGPGVFVRGDRHRYSAPAAGQSLPAPVPPGGRP